MVTIDRDDSVVNEIADKLWNICLEYGGHLVGRADGSIDFCDSPGQCGPSTPPNLNLSQALELKYPSASKANERLV